MNQLFALISPFAPQLLRNVQFQCLLDDVVIAVNTVIFFFFTEAYRNCITTLLNMQSTTHDSSSLINTIHAFIVLFRQYVADFRFTFIPFTTFSQTFLFIFV